MQLWHGNSILEFENREVCNLFFDALKLNRSLANTTTNIIKFLNLKQKQYKQNLADYKKAYSTIKNDISFAIDENPTQNYSEFLKYSAWLSARITHADYLKSEVFKAYKHNQTKIFEDYSSNKDSYSPSEKSEVKKSAEEVVSLYQKFSETKHELNEALLSDAVTLDQVLFVENQIKILKDKLENFPFSTEENYGELLSLAKDIKNSTNENNEEKEND